MRCLYREFRGRGKEQTGGVFSGLTVGPTEEGLCIVTILTTYMNGYTSNTIKVYEVEKVGQVISRIFGRKE